MQNAAIPRAQSFTLFGATTPAPEGETWVDNIIRYEELTILDESTAMNFKLELFFASIWVLMIAGIPLITRKVSGRAMTKVQLAVSAVLWVAIFGGLFLFTNIILFGSGHFSRVRPLYLVECIYVMAQVITTVGYGDITPAKPRGQIFVALYVMMAIFVIANIVSDMIAHVADQVARAKSDARAAQHRELKNFQSHSDADVAKQKEHAALMVMKHDQAPSVKPFLSALAVFFGFAGVWVIFFSQYPGENKTVFQATYMSIVTLSSVGFGAFLPQTHAGMVFAAFWMIFGCAALVAVVTKFTELVVAYSDFERFNPHSATQALREWRQTAGRDEMDEADFMAFGLHMGGHVSDKEVALARQSFRSLQRNGVVNLNDLKAESYQPGRL